MPVDPQLATLLAGFEPFMSIDWTVMDVKSVRVMAEQGVPPTPDFPMASISDHHVPTADGGIRTRLFRPFDAEGLPTILFLHGGGWVMGTLDGYDGFCRRLALDAGCAVLSVDYRLAPEHPYPAAIDDCFAALEWLAANARSLGLAEDRIAVAGDSAGGNLSAVLAKLARDRGGPKLRHQLLLYPVTDRACDSPSFAENDRYLLTPAMMRWYWSNYVGDRPDGDVPLAAPARFEDLAGLPPATVITAQYDPLRDEGEAYALALARAGVPTELVRVPGMIHGFASMIGVVDAAETWLRHAAERLARELTEDGVR